MHFATARSRRAGLMVVGGIAVGTAIWATGIGYRRRLAPATVRS